MAWSQARSLRGLAIIYLACRLRNTGLHMCLLDTGRRGQIREETASMIGRGKGS